MGLQSLPLLLELSKHYNWSLCVCVGGGGGGGGGGSFLMGLANTPMGAGRGSQSHVDMG